MYRMQEGEGGTAGGEWELRDVAQMISVLVCSLSKGTAAQILFVTVYLSLISYQFPAHNVVSCECPTPTPNSVFHYPCPPAPRKSTLSSPRCPWFNPCLHCSPASCLLPLHCLRNRVQDRPHCSQHLLAWEVAGPRADGSNYAKRSFVPWPLHSMHSCVFGVMCTGWPASRTEVISINLQIKVLNS